jgi:DNA-binding NtrC family response regulator
MKHILIVEDEDIIRSALKRLLERNEYQVSEADSITAAKRDHVFSNYDMIISDLRLPGGVGTDLIALADDTPVLIMTSYASLKSAVDAMKEGAVDYIAKPFNHEEMLLSVKRILKERTLVLENKILKEQVKKEFPVSGIIGQCPPMKSLFSKISKIAPTTATVLIMGESGTGKELVARAIHDQSPRAKASMISVNCAAIPDTLIESELFGHEKGAFTGAVSARTGLVEAADGGTLFLDEIGELPLEAQARLLRVLQEGEIRKVGAITSKKVDVRLVAATHRNLKALSQSGDFREDLYFRLNVIELNLPPLRDRGDDVIELANTLLQRRCEKMGRPGLHFSEQCLLDIAAYQWPGNVRELENAVERAVILSDDLIINSDLLAIDINESTTRATQVDASSSDTINSDSSTALASEETQEVSLEDYFKRFVLDNEGSMNETELAQQLGISRKSLWERRNRLGIPRNKNK